MRVEDIIDGVRVLRAALAAPLAFLLLAQPGLAAARTSRAEQPAAVADQRISLEPRTSLTDMPASLADQGTSLADQRTSLADQRTSVADQRTSLADQRISPADQRTGTTVEP